MTLLLRSVYKDKINQTSVLDEISPFNMSHSIFHPVKWENFTTVRLDRTCWEVGYHPSGIRFFPLTSLWSWKVGREFTYKLVLISSFFSAFGRGYGNILSIQTACYSLMFSLFWILVALGVYDQLLNGGVLLWFRKLRYAFFRNGTQHYERNDTKILHSALVYNNYGKNLGLP